jgi:hypothetical protein
MKRRESEPGKEGAVWELENTYVKTSQSRLHVSNKAL